MSAWNARVQRVAGAAVGGAEPAGTGMGQPRARSIRDVATRAARICGAALGVVADAPGNPVSGSSPRRAAASRDTEATHRPRWGCGDDHGGRTAASAGLGRSWRTPGRRPPGRRVCRCYRGIRSLAGPHCAVGAMITTWLRRDRALCSPVCHLGPNALPLPADGRVLPEARILFYNNLSCIPSTRSSRCCRTGWGAFPSRDYSPGRAPTVPPVRSRTRSEPVTETSVNSPLSSARQ